MSFHFIYLFLMIVLSCLMSVKLLVVVTCEAQIEREALSGCLVLSHVKCEHI